MEIKDIEEILALMKQNDVTEFELERDGTHIRLTRSTGSMSGHGSFLKSGALEPAIASSTLNASGLSSEPRPVEPSLDLVKVESPMVGTFYRKPSPDAESFVKEGDVIKKGDTLCIIEAMKLMNEIESPCTGRIEKILLNDGQVVEFGEVLFLVNSHV